MQGLEGFDHGMESPAFDLFLQLGLDALPRSWSSLTAPHVLLEDDLLGGSGADHLGKPAKMCRSLGFPSERISWRSRIRP